MLATLFLSLILSQAPCPSSDGTILCHCKQGREAACQELAEAYPEVYKKLVQGWAMAKAAEKARKGEKAEVEVDTGCDQPPDDGGKGKKKCTGQKHHPLSKKIWEVLEERKDLKGKFKYRDERYVTRAVDEEAHCGYQDWHRKLDEEIVAWLDKRPKLTPEQFLAYLREVYKRPELQKRFPNGF